MPRTVAALLVAVIAAACTASPPPTVEPHAGHTPGTSPSVSASDEHAGHSVGDSGASVTPHPSAPDGADGTIVLADELAVGGSGLSVAEGLDLASSQPVLVNGILLRDVDGAIWFCTALEDGEPPACGHPALAVENFPPDESVFEPENARGTGSQTEGGVTWITNQQLYGVVHPAP
jgi:hypothetical protein